MNGRPAKVHMKYIERNDGSVIPVRLKDSWLSVLRPGCTFCFRRRLLEKFSVMDIDKYLHDNMLWKYAIVSDSLYLMNRQLIFWRRHENVATGVDFSARPNIEQRVKDTYASEETLRNFLNASDGLDITPENITLLNDAANFAQKRRRMLEKRSLLNTALFVMMNIKYYPTLRNALSDIYAMIFLK